MLSTLSTPELTAIVSTAGGELVALKDEASRDLLWDGDPAFWTGRSPLLFPIVGGLKDKAVLIDGKTHRLDQHGFARTSTFDLVEAESSSCRMALHANSETRALYPFDFTLEIAYRIERATLTMTASVTNRDTRPMPVSFGYHPAFRWPLPYGGARHDHQMVFEKDEPAPTRMLDGGLLGGPAPRSPVEGKRLGLHDALFEKGALVFDRLASRSVTYGVPDKRSIVVRFAHMPHLGIWTKPGAGFVCIEPWQGYASPVEFDGELSAKPGIVMIAPGDSRSFAMDIEITRDVG